MLTEWSVRQGSFVSIKYFYQEICKYWEIAVVRPATSATLLQKLQKSFGKDDLNASKMLKRIFRLRPNFLKYIVIYNPDIISDYKHPVNSEIMLVDSTNKLCALLCLLVDQRCQVI